MNEVNQDNFNETMKGYLIRACRECEYTAEQKERLFSGLRWAIDEMTMSDARKELEKYQNGKIVFKSED